MGAYNTLNLKEELKQEFKNNLVQIFKHKIQTRAFRYQGCALTPKWNIICASTKARKHAGYWCAKLIAWNNYFVLSFLHNWLMTFEIQLRWLELRFQGPETNLENVNVNKTVYHNCNWFMTITCGCNVIAKNWARQITKLTSLHLQLQVFSDLCKTQQKWITLTLLAMWSEWVNR